MFTVECHVQMGIRVMDSNDQERERGITILAKVRVLPNAGHATLLAFASWAASHSQMETLPSMNSIGYFGLQCCTMGHVSLASCASGLFPGFFASCIAMNDT